MGHENVAPKPGKFWTILTILIAGLRRRIWTGKQHPDNLILDLFVELKEQGKKMGPTW